MIIIFVVRINMRKIYYIVALLLGIIFTLPLSLSAQNSGTLMGYRVEGSDTVYVGRINEINVYNWKESTKKSKEWREYYRLVYNFKKTYPYALMAKQKVMYVDSVLSNSSMRKAEEERFIKKFENDLFSEFEKPLRNMTFSQGRLLLRLIDREVGQTSFYLIRDYKGGAAAGFWQGIAKIFGSDLKKPYDKFGEDKLTEELVMMYYRGTFDYLYYSIF